MYVFLKNDLNLVDMSQRMIEGNTYILFIQHRYKCDENSYLPTKRTTILRTIVYSDSVICYSTDNGFFWQTHTLDGLRNVIGWECIDNDSN